MCLILQNFNQKRSWDRESQTLWNGELYQGKNEMSTDRWHERVENADSKGSAAGEWLQNFLSTLIPLQYSWLHMFHGSLQKKRKIET